MKRKIIFYILIIAVLVVAIYFLISYFSEAKGEKQLTRQMTLSDTFPSNIKPYVDELKKQYPNWEFKALYTNLDPPQEIFDRLLIMGRIVGN